jgi:hypothetical protein
MVYKTEGVARTSPNSILLAKGDRPWTSSVYNAHEYHKLIEYWPLVDHSDLLGAKWFRGMVCNLPEYGLISELG